MCFVIAGKGAELEALLQLAGVLTTIVNGPFTVKFYILKLPAAYWRVCVVVIFVSKKAIKYAVI